MRQIGRIAMANNKALGQHWLNNRGILDEIAELARGGNGDDGVDSSADDFSGNRGGVCLEIGPGLGTLTASLLRRFDKVVAVEFDEDLARKLPGSFPGTKLEVVNEDILQFDLGKMPQGYTVAGNIPYYITSPIIEKVLTTENMPRRVVLLIQKEVAERIASDKGSVLSMMVKNRADVELGPVVLRDEFTPPPEVDSQVIVLKPHAPIVSDKVMKLIRIGFSAPRKKVTRNLATVVPREELKMEFVRMNINIDVRPAELSLRDWQRVYDAVIKIMSKY